MEELKNGGRALERLSEVSEQTIRWLWKPYLPFRKVSVLHGKLGIGKSIFAARLAAACTNRRYLPGMEELEPCNVLYLTADVDLSDLVKPRLLEAGADPERVYAIHDMLPLMLANDNIEQLIMEHGVHLLVVDTIQDYIEQDIYGEKPEQVYPVINKLEKMARNTGCAVLLLAYSDGPGGDCSLAWKACYAEKISSVLCLGRADDKGDRRWIIHEKNKLGMEGNTLLFTLGNMGISEELQEEKNGPGRSKPGNQ